MRDPTTDKDIDALMERWLLRLKPYGPAITEFPTGIVVVFLLLVWISTVIYALPKLAGTDLTTVDVAVAALFISSIWQGLLIYALCAAYRIKEKTEGTHKELERKRFKRDVKIFLVLLFLLLLLFIASRVRAQDDPLLQSVGPDVALLPDLAHALPFISPETPAVLATKAPVGTPPVGTSPIPPPTDAISPSCPRAPADATPCIQAALNAGDVVLPEGTYLAHGLWLRSGRYFGGASNLATLHNPLVTRNSTDSTLMMSGVRNAVVTNLTFVNAGDPVKPIGQLHIAGEFTSAIDMQGGSSNNRIVANRFGACQGDTCIVLYGGQQSDADNSNVIAGNTFTACSSYAVAIVDGNNNYVGGNWLKDCSLGSEADATCSQTNSGNQYVRNTIQNVNGVSLYLGNQVFSATEMTAPMITGGAASYGCNHYTNIVANNTYIGEVHVIPMQ
jgi:hypothetical protein